MVTAFPRKIGSTENVGVDVVRVIRGDIVDELKIIKSSGVARVVVDRCPTLLDAALYSDVVDVRDPHGALLKLLHGVLVDWDTAPGVAAATSVLLGMEPETQFETLTSGRRQRAAQLVGYSVSTMARRKEAEFLTRFADEILVRHRRSVLSASGRAVG